MTTTDGTTLLSEEFVQNCFHSYLKSALTQAKAERLLDTDLLASAEGDLMITGPALCLYFAALRSTTDPPSVPLPRSSKSRSTPVDLSLSNCPPPFRPFLIVWSQQVPIIQALVPEHQHDLARVICGLSPISVPPNPRVKGIAADLRAVAIEISMRRTFQDRYASDLQAAIDAGGHSNLRVKASFVPPPVYDGVKDPTTPTSPATSVSSIRSRTPSPAPSILGPDSPAIEFIRETLYAALADALERTPALRRLLHHDAPRAYFASVAFAILDVATTSVYSDTDGMKIRGVLGKALSLDECPQELRPFMRELCDIGLKAREMEEEDSEASVRALQEGRTPPTPRIDRVQDILKGGVGHAYNEERRSGEFSRNGNGRTSPHEGGHHHHRYSGQGDTGLPDPRRRRTSTENRAVAFANRINALALSMTKLRAFRERQEIVFKVLIGVAS